MKKKTKNKPFTDYRILSEYPEVSVPEHELFLSFNYDEDALDFVSWLRVEGMKRFQKWLDDGRPAK